MNPSLLSGSAATLWSSCLLDYNSKFMVSKRSPRTVLPPGLLLPAPGTSPPRALRCLPKPAAKLLARLLGSVTRARGRRLRHASRPRPRSSRRTLSGLHAGSWTHSALSGCHTFTGQVSASMSLAQTWSTHQTTRALPWALAVACDPAVLPLGTLLPSPPGSSWSSRRHSERRCLVLGGAPRSKRICTCAVGFSSPPGNANSMKPRTKTPSLVPRGACHRSQTEQAFRRCLQRYWEEEKRSPLKAWSTWKFRGLTRQRLRVWRRSED